MPDGSCRILVVEDEPAMAHVIGFNLKRVGFDVVLAKNGREGMECVMERQFDLIITDQQMPVMNGTEFCRQMRKLDAYADVPMIMLTAKGLELEPDFGSKNLGISVMFPKPFSPSELVEAVQHCLAPNS